MSNFAPPNAIQYIEVKEKHFYVSKMTGIYLFELCLREYFKTKVLLEYVDKGPFKDQIAVRNLSTHVILCYVLYKSYLHEYLLVPGTFKIYLP